MPIFHDLLYLDTPDFTWDINPAFKISSYKKNFTSNSAIVEFPRDTYSKSQNLIFQSSDPDLFLIIIICLLNFKLVRYVTYCVSLHESLPYIEVWTNETYLVSMHPDCYNICAYLFQITFRYVNIQETLHFFYTATGSASKMHLWCFQPAVTPVSCLFALKYVGLYLLVCNPQVSILPTNLEFNRPLNAMTWTT